MDGASRAAREIGLDFEEVTKISVEISFVVRDVYLTYVAFREVFESTRHANVGEAERTLWQMHSDAQLALG